MTKQMSDPFLLNSSHKDPKGGEKEKPSPTKLNHSRSGRRERTFRDLKILGIDQAE